MHIEDLAFACIQEAQIIMHAGYARVISQDKQRGRGGGIRENNRKKLTQGQIP